MDHKEEELWKYFPSQAFSQVNLPSEPVRVEQAAERMTLPAQNSSTGERPVPSQSNHTDVQ